MPEVTIKGGHGGKIDAKKGQLIEVIAVEGKQVCDFFAFNSDNIREMLSPAHTRSVLRGVKLKLGDVVYTNLRRPMLEFVADTTDGTHDFCMPPCDPERYVLSFGIRNHRSCRTNLAETMHGFNIPYEYLPDPINFFQPTPINADGSVGFNVTSTVKAGQKVVLKALMNVVAAVSSCPQDINPLNNYRPSPLKLVVRDA